MLCLTSARFNMSAIVLIQGADADPDTVDVTSTNGRYVVQQDPESGSFIRVWEAVDIDPDTVGIQSARIPLIARGIIDGGIRVAGTTQRFTPQGGYENVEYVNIQFPADILVTKKDRISDIRGPGGDLIWKEEESDDAATVFNVLGVTPIVDPFGNHIENQALLQRSEVQQYGN